MEAYKKIGWLDHVEDVATGEVIQEFPAYFAYRAKLAEKVPEYAACLFTGTGDHIAAIPGKTSEVIHRVSAPRSHRCRT